MAHDQLRTLALCMAAFIALACVYMASIEYLGGEPSRQAMTFYNFAFAFLVACGVEADRRVRRVRAPYEYAAFVFFLWPIAVPVYLIRTRRWRGLAIALGVLVLSELPFLAALLVYFFIAPSDT